MHITDTFASTVAVTIPVLMLAGTVELRSLSDSVAKEMAKWPNQYVLRFTKFAKRLVGLSNGRGWHKVLPMVQAIILLPSLIPLPGGAAYFLSFLWVATVIASGVAETFCLSYLVGIHVPVASVPLSIVSIVVLIALLIVTPTTRTLIFAPTNGLMQYFAKLKEQQGFDVDSVNVLLDAIPDFVGAKLMSPEEGEEYRKKFQSILSKATLVKNDGQRRRRPYTQTRSISSPRPPRSTTRRRNGRSW